MPAAVTGSPRLAQMNSAAALSDSVMAAVIASVTLGGFSSRSAAMISGTLIVDQAGPLCHSPQCVWRLPTADGSDRDAHHRVQLRFQSGEVGGQPGCRRGWRSLAAAQIIADDHARCQRHRRKQCGADYQPRTPLRGEGRRRGGGPARRDCEPGLMSSGCPLCMAAAGLTWPAGSGSSAASRVDHRAPAGGCQRGVWFASGWSGSVAIWKPDNR